MRPRTILAWLAAMLAVSATLAFSSYLSPALADEGSAAVAEAADAPSTEGEEDAAPRFIRLKRTDKDLQALQTAIVRYEQETPDGKKRPLRVDLIAAVHIGEPSYYEELNDRFEKYDSVLYELVAPEGMEAPSADAPKSSHPIGVLQRVMKNMLELEFQLDGIDYEKENFVHADMTAEQFAKTMSERGESFLSMFFQMMLEGMAKQSAGKQKTTDLELIMALFQKDRALALKRILAEEMEDVESQLSFLDGPDGSTILTERNKVALGVLKERLDAGDRRIAIFYGGAHMPDMEERLHDEFGLAPTKTTWLDAWRLSGDDKEDE